MKYECALLAEKQSVTEKQSTNKTGNLKSSLPSLELKTSRKPRNILHWTWRIKEISALQAILLMKIDIRNVHGGNLNIQSLVSALCYCVDFCLERPVLQDAEVSCTSAIMFVLAIKLFGQVKKVFTTLKLMVLLYWCHPNSLFPVLSVCL